MTNRSDATQTMLGNAADHLRSAIELLDSASAPGHIAAHADLALNLLENLIREAAAPAEMPIAANVEQLRRSHSF